MDSNGNPIEAPSELVWAQTMISLCERFHALPSQVMAEPWGPMLYAVRLVDIAAEARQEMEAPPVNPATQTHGSVGIGGGRLNIRGNPVGQ